jgi:hypothetical protein
MLATLSPSGQKNNVRQPAKFKDALKITLTTWLLVEKRQSKA